MSEEVDGDQCRDHGTGEHEVCCDDASDLTGEGDCGRNRGEVAADCDGVGGFQCEV